MMNLILSFFAAFIIAALLGIWLIPLLHRLKFGQQIRDEGPSWHEKKSGTPTMGGIIFIAAVVLAGLIFAFSQKSVAVLVCALLFGAVGFIDDFIKVVKKRNLGLTAIQKFSMQLVISIAYTVYLLYTGAISSELLIPFAGSVDFGLFFIPLVIFVMLATVNSVNLTDGLDGLASFITLAVALFFALSAKKLGFSDIQILCIALCGAICGFLIYNAHPAKVFMGDTGSLFLGGFISAAAIMLGMELFLLISGFVYVAETLSVIIQVVSFKTTGKRVFKMSPIHHHFEMCGFKENKIVFIFSLVTVILCIIAYVGIGA